MTDPTPPTDPAPDTGAEKLQAEVDKWKALARKHEGESKKMRDELDALKKAGDTTKSDMDKVIAKLDAAEKRAAEADRRALHGEVVAATGLSMAKVARLKGETVEELMADAAEVFDWKPKDEESGGEGKSGKGAGEKPKGDESKGEQEKSPNPYARPREALKPDPGSNEELAKSPQEMADAILQRRF